ncbi:hypothetical protein BXY66_0837 [Shimia isoporae]|uniref:Uncharacterized protein n=1 Tax=Shimia isoporae TaxID=647720 RepID=A0A4R1NKG0_9RHOB|nr:hypothetical protein BXY66_0837 [Shimia isoporae]
MSASARSSAMARHPALNRLPRDFIGRGTIVPLEIPNALLKGDAP